jgi:hypothetical protein
MGELSWLAKGWAGCTPVKLGSDKEISEDLRYKKAGLQVTEYDLMQNNGIL